MRVRRMVMSYEAGFKGISLSSPSEEDKLVHRFSVAPMMDYTDRHQRFLFSLISERSVLYTEMVTANALVHNAPDVTRFLESDFHRPNPVVLQLGGSDPQQMYQAGVMASKFGFKEPININCGCPSDKVAEKGCFGAALMMEPHMVVDISRAVGDATGSAPSIKCRIGVNDDATYDKLHSFIARVSEEAGVHHFIVHARAAILGAKLSPHDNRTIPPLKYEYVYRLLSDFPHLMFTINGGILSYEECREHLAQGVHGVMVGRACIDAPYYWRNIDSRIYGGSDPGCSRRDIIDKYGDYAIAIEQGHGRKARRALMKPLLGMFAGEPRGKIFRTRMDELIRDENRPMAKVFTEAAECLLDETLDFVDAHTHNAA